MLPDLFLGSVADQQFHRTIFVNEAIQWLMGVCLSLDGICRREEVFVREYLAKLLAVDGPTSHVHSIGCESPLKPVH